MKIRTVLLVAAALLSLAALANATPAPAGATAAPAWLAPACDSNLSAVPPELSGNAPSFMETLMCGSCSAPPCKNVGYGGGCFVGTTSGTCLSQLGNNCTDGTWQCLCWSGPLP